MRALRRPARLGDWRSPAACARTSVASAGPHIVPRVLPQTASSFPPAPRSPTATRAAPTRCSRELRARPGQLRPRRTLAESQPRPRRDHNRGRRARCRRRVRRRAICRNAHARSITPVPLDRHAVERADHDDVRSSSGVIGEPKCGAHRMVTARRARDAAGYVRAAYACVADVVRVFALPVCRGRGKLEPCVLA